MPADGGFGVEVAGLALVVGVDGAGTLRNSPAAVGASGGGKVGPSPRVNGLNIEESWRGGGGSGGCVGLGGGGESEAKAGVGDDALPPTSPTTPMLAGGVGLARDMGRKDVGEEVAGLGGAGDPCPEGVTKDASRDGVMAIGVGASFENGQANVVAMRVTCAAAGTDTGDGDGPAGEGTGGGALNTKVRGENLPKLKG